jgi:phosphoglucosamine mutase
MGRLFGTDGVRGVANLDPMTSEMAMKVGRAAAHVFRKRESRHQIIIGKDTRISGYMLESALTAGLCSMGVDVLLVGPLPTPAIAFLTRSLRADAGVMISASHNPYQDNGIKFFSNDGMKLPDELEQRIEDLILSNEIEHIRPTAEAIGKAFRIDDAEGRYIEFVKRSLPRDMDFQNLKIVLDCANGAGYHVFPKVIRELGAKVWVTGNEPDGLNINDGCGAVHPERLQQMVRDLKRQGRLKKDTVVGTVMSNFGFDLAMREAGITLIRTAVGDRYILERMVADQYNLGGEQSGHMIFMDYHTSGDGLITGLQMLKLMKRTQKPLSEITQCMHSTPQVLLGVKVPHKPDLESLPALQQAIQDKERELNGTGRILVRYSGTEPLLRVMVEGQDDRAIQEIAEDLVNVVKSCIH